MSGSRSVRHQVFARVFRGIIEKAKIRKLGHQDLRTMSYSAVKVLFDEVEKRSHGSNFFALLDLTQSVYCQNPLGLKNRENIEIAYYIALMGCIEFSLADERIVSKSKSVVLREKLESNLTSQGPTVLYQICNDIISSFLDKNSKDIDSGAFSDQDFRDLIYQTNESMIPKLFNHLLG